MHFFWHDRTWRRIDSLRRPFGFAIFTMYFLCSSCICDDKRQVARPDTPPGRSIPGWRGLCSRTVQFCNFTAAQKNERRLILRPQWTKTARLYTEKRFDGFSNDDNKQNNKVQLNIPTAAGPILQIESSEP